MWRLKIFFSSVDLSVSWPYLTVILLLSVHLLYVNNFTFWTSSLKPFVRSTLNLVKVSNKFVQMLMGQWFLAQLTCHTAECILLSSVRHPSIIHICSFVFACLVQDHFQRLSNAAIFTSKIHILVKYVCLNNMYHSLILKTYFWYDWPHQGLLAIILTTHAQEPGFGVLGHNYLPSLINYQR